jgi:hypothetical protein
MSEKENIHSINRFRIIPDKSKRALLKTNKELPSVKSIKDRSMKTIVEIEPHHIDRFLFGTFPSLTELKKFATLLYQGLFYSACSLKGPTEDYLCKKSIRLPEPKCNSFLMQKAKRNF